MLHIVRTLFLWRGMAYQSLLVQSVEQSRPQARPQQGRAGQRYQRRTQGVARVQLRGFSNLSARVSNFAQTGRVTVEQMTARLLRQPGFSLRATDLSGTFGSRGTLVF